VTITAGILGDANQAAVGAALDMAAEPRSPTGLDCGHDASLGSAETVRFRPAVRVTVAAEDVRHLEGRQEPSQTGLAWIAYLVDDQCDRAVECSLRSLSENSTYTIAHRILVISLMMSGRKAEAQDAAVELRRLEPSLRSRAFSSATPAVAALMLRDLVMPWPLLPYQYKMPR